MGRVLGLDSREWVCYWEGLILTSCYDFNLIFFWKKGTNFIVTFCYLVSYITIFNLVFMYMVCIMPYSSSTK